MKAPQNYIFVKVESEFNDEISIGNGKKLFLTTSEFHADDNLDNSNFKPTMIQRHYGTVVGIPFRLTEEVKIRQVDPGLPAPGNYIPNEEVNKISKYTDSWACLNSFEYKWKTCADFEMEVQEGDKIYFHHNTITEDNVVGSLNDEKMWKLEYQNAICVVRNSEIIPIACHVLVEPLWQDGVQDLGDGKKGKITSSGIISELHEKPEFLQGRVAFAGNPFKGEEQELKPGDKIFYLPHSDYEVEIEGKTYFVMKYWEIIAKFE